MSSYYDEPDDCDDGAFITIRFNNILREDHPALLIKRFISTLDLSSFEKRYNVGQGKKGRPPKGIRMMLGLVLYAIYSRMFSTHQIEYASYNYSDFWVFTHKKRVSHDKISDFINLHEEEMKSIFLETIILSDRNKLLNFDVLFQDGFFIKANASKRKNRKWRALEKKEQRISQALEQILTKFKDRGEDEETKKAKEKLEKKLDKISELKKELNERIEERRESRRKDKFDEDEISINETDSDSSLMKMKDKSYANAYLKVTATDSKADIIVGSILQGYCDEPHNTVPLFNQVNKNCKGLGGYDTVCYDSGFNTMGTSAAFESMGVKAIAPTKEYEHQKRHPEECESLITFDYDEDKHEVICSEGKVFTKAEKSLDSSKGTVIYKFSNEAECKKCKRLKDCTSSKNGFRKVKIDSRQPCQQRVLARYKSEQGQEIYKQRSHCAETFQGDLKQNGKFERFYRRGLQKVRIDSIMHDIVWNLRRIFNCKNLEIMWV